MKVQTPNQQVPYHNVKFKNSNSKSFLFQSPTIKQCNTYICLGYIWTSQNLHTNLKTRHYITHNNI
jgi:hypothetical protein